MLTLVGHNPWHRKLGRFSLFVLSPLAFLAWFLPPTAWVSRVSFEPFRGATSVLPVDLRQFLEEVMTFYVGTLFALVIALVCAMVRRKSVATVRQWSDEPALGWFIPVLVAGLEALRQFEDMAHRWHGVVPAPTLAEIRHYFLMAAFSSLFVMVLAVVVGAVAARIARASRRVPLMVVPAVLAVALDWYLFLRFVDWMTGTPR